MPFQDRTDGSVHYLSSTTAPLYRASSADSRGKDPKVMELLWGDRVRRVTADGTDSFVEENGRWQVRARGEYGWLDPADLDPAQPALLELYFVDVGQGDGVLIRTPNNRHILIDAGWPRARQPAGKNAADFVDWKFMKDYESELKAIELDVLICSHNDQDHYGGLWDLLDSTQWVEGDAEELDASAVLVEQIYHAGVSWWKKEGERWLGPTASTDEGKFLTQLLDDRASVEAALEDEADPALQGEWAKFLKECTAAKTREGDPTPIHRLSTEYDHLPGFEPGPTTDGVVPEPVIHVLAPVAFEIDGSPAVRHFPGGDSKNTNGNSILLRLDCGNVRILLTGDLNTASQRALLDDWEDHSVFECDVAKACHHGSNDVSLEFLQKMRPRVTVISSGDSEGHDHPRPEIISASAVSGDVTLDEEGNLKTPLIFCTELARSLEIGRIRKIEDIDDSVSPPAARLMDLARLEATAEVVLAGARNPRSVLRRLANRYLMTDNIYGLINVRTDGERIVCAALNEAKRTWNVSEVEPKARA